MNRINIDDFQNSLHTGFIDKEIKSDTFYQPELLVNRKTPPQKILSTIVRELSVCKSFKISVAFVTTDGVATIINTLKVLEKRGVKGKILVSQYLNFTQPEALRRLLNFNNIELRIATIDNSHSKGYIFENESHYNLIIGSSNLTATALATNKEWNLKVSAIHSSNIVSKVLSEFEVDFHNGTVVTDEYIHSYEEIYKNQRIFSKRSEKDFKENIKIEISPNDMQKEALKNLSILRSANKNKALLISATGTGKTYLSAFDAKACNVKKLLFVVHRRTIAQKSLETFKQIFGNSRTMGLFSGSSRELEKDFIFSTVQTISKPENLILFQKEYFDYIVIDETHRSGAETYQRLVKYFKPDFLLGMTATPERTDGNDIYSIFDHNIAYEIRLHRALEEDMLCQFHYYGVTDISVDDIVLERNSDFNLLTATERINSIITNARFYGTDNGVVRGLIFCSRTIEAKRLSNEFNKRGFKTVALTGEDSEDKRAESIELLETDDLSKKLDYIFTVDIFNEGVDIPKINQIIMLRPTESAIIFVQQLGRGLRKTDGKHYLTIIDFIGNYEHNFLIPIAIYGDNSYNKDNIRKHISEGSRLIPGASTVNFDEITKDRIFKSIDASNLKLKKDLKNDYLLLKYKLGRIPMMVDFVEHGERDPFSFVEYSRSYFNFVTKVETDFPHDLKSESLKLLELFSNEINNAKRVEECVVLKILIENNSVDISFLRDVLLTDYKIHLTDETLNSCIRNLNFEFVREIENGKLIPVKNKYNISNIKINNTKLVLEKTLLSSLESRFFNQFLLDSVDFSILSFNNKFSRENWQNGFIMYQKYSRKDVFRILNYDVNPLEQNVGGYHESLEMNCCPIFINYHKEESISESTKYEDRFKNNKQMFWMSKSNRTLNSKHISELLEKFDSIRFPLFVKKNNDEGKEYYYLGDAKPNPKETIQTSMKNDKNKSVPVVQFLLNLDVPVEDSLYNYLTEVVKNEIEVNKNFDLQLSSEAKYSQIPFYSFYAAAGTFSEMQFDKGYSLLNVPEKYSNSNEYFACKVVGESMNRIIPNGTISIFRKYEGGSRNGKIVLVENNDIQDPDFKSAFTVKTYTSEKNVTDEGWEHTSIKLKPNSYDTSYQDLVINEENGANMKVIGVWVENLN